MILGLVSGVYDLWVPTATVTESRSMTPTYHCARVGIEGDLQPRNKAALLMAGFDFPGEGRLFFGPLDLALPVGAILVDPEEPGFWNLEGDVSRFPALDCDDGHLEAIFSRLQTPPTEIDRAYPRDGAG